MSHPDLDLILRYLDDQLAPADHVAAELHVSRCADCTRLVDEHRRIVDTARASSLAGLEAGDDLWKRIEADRADRTSPLTVPIIQLRHSSPRFGWVAASAAALLLAAAGGTVVSRNDRGNPAEAMSVGGPAVAREGGYVDALPFEPSQSTALPEARAGVPSSAITADQLYRSLADAADTIPDYRNLLDAPVFTPFEVRPELINRAEYAAGLNRAMVNAPDIGMDQAQTLLWVLIDAEGIVRATRVVRSSGSAIADSIAAEAMHGARFVAARNRNAPVPVWIQIPVTLTKPNR